MTTEESAAIRSRDRARLRAKAQAAAQRKLVGRHQEEYDALYREAKRILELQAEDEAQPPARCPKCGHEWSHHDQLLKGAGKLLKPEYNPNGVEDLYECTVYAGMGNWCGCEERSRQPTSALKEKK